jgi:hypothetical protein
LAVAGGIAVLIFFWLYSGFHPLGQADLTVQDTQIDQLSTKLLQEFGYRSERDPVVQFMANNEILDSLQVKHDFHEYYSNPHYRSLSPVYYWNSRFSMGEREDDNTFVLFDNGHRIINIQFSESGDFIAFENEEQLLPNYSDPSQESTAALDSLLQKIGVDQSGFTEIDFQMNQRTGQPVDSSFVVENERLILNSTHAADMALSYLEQSGWPERYFTKSAVNVENLEDNRIASVDFVHDGRFSGMPVTVSISVLPSGQLLSFTYAYDTLPETNSVLEITIAGLRVILILIGVFWIVILLFVRFRMRLIDMKAAILVAV